MGILKSLNIVNLYRVMSLLKLKINVNLPQLLRIVVSAAQKRNPSDLRGFALTVTARYKEIRVESSFSTAPAPSRFLRLLLIPCSNSQSKTHQIAQIRHSEPQERQ